MKKLFITVVLAAFTMMAHAQFIVGGQLGFNTSSSTFKPNQGDDVRSPRDLEFTIAPQVGFQISERFILGVEIFYVHASRTQFNWAGTDDNRRLSNNLFGFGIFAQYSILEINRFSVLANFGVGLGFANERERIGSEQTDPDLWRATVFNAGVSPMLAFDLNERIRLTANLNFQTYG